MDKTRGKRHWASANFILEGQLNLVCMFVCFFVCMFACLLIGCFHIACLVIGCLLVACFLLLAFLLFAFLFACLPIALLSVLGSEKNKIFLLSLLSYVCLNFCKETKESIWLPIYEASKFKPYQSYIHSVMTRDQIWVTIRRKI